MGSEMKVDMSHRLSKKTKNLGDTGFLRSGGLPITREPGKLETLHFHKDYTVLSQGAER